MPPRSVPADQVPFTPAPHRRRAEPPTPAHQVGPHSDPTLYSFREKQSSAFVPQTPKPQPQTMALQQKDVKSQEGKEVAVKKGGELRKTKAPTPLATLYLVTYNVLSALGWSAVLLLTLTHLLSGSPAPSLAALRAAPLTASKAYLASLSSSSCSSAALLARARTTYTAVGWLVRVVQTAAALEVVHVLLGLVRSPIVTTAMQVASRLFLVWRITEMQGLQFEQARYNPIYATMVISWSVTEIIRYSFYACNLLGSKPAFLNWLRYTTFYVLYPSGAGSEAFLIFSTLPARLPDTVNWWPGDIGRVTLFAIWWPGLYIMYTHMIKQRRRVFGGAGAAKAKAKKA